jgi:hypothetical protein
MQLRDNDLKVYDEPNFMLEHSMDDCHVPVIGELCILLSLKGGISYLTEYKPTIAYEEQSHLENINELTYEHHYLGDSPKFKKNLRRKA